MQLGGTVSPSFTWIDPQVDPAGHGFDVSQARPTLERSSRLQVFVCSQGCPEQRRVQAHDASFPQRSHCAPASPYTHARSS